MKANPNVKLTNDAKIFTGRFQQEVNTTRRGGTVSKSKNSEKFQNCPDVAKIKFTKKCALALCTNQNRSCEVNTRIPRHKQKNLILNWKTWLLLDHVSCHSIDFTKYISLKFIGANMTCYIQY